MKTKQRIKNLIGSFLGYSNCPITGDTYWHTDTVSVPYTENRGVLISARAFSEVPAEDIARKVHEISRDCWHGFERGYSLEKITEQIPEGCAPIPRR